MNRLACIVLASAELTGCGDECAPRSSASVRRDGDVVLEACLDRAVTEEERRTGLAAYDDLSADEGLLIELPDEGEVCISAELVELSFDAVFIDDDGIIRHFARDVPPFDETLRCHDNVRWVLELAAGAARPLVEGDVVDLTLRAEQP